MMSNKASRIKSINTRISKKDSSWIKKIFNYRCYITFLTGCYSCHWKFRQWEETKLGSCCCPRKEQVFFVFLVISFILSVILLFMWIEMSNEYFGFDWVLFLETGFWVFGSIIFLSILGTLTAYTTLLLIVGVLLLRERIELYLHKCHKVLIVLVILFYIFFMFMLFVYWNDKWLTFGLSLQIFSPYIHLCSITVMVLLSWPLTCYIARLEREALQLATGLPFLLILICLYLMPLGIYSPCIQKKEDLAPKPVFFAHRGAPMHGPENTMMAFEKAVEFGAYGLETDVHISIDHVPFLMHDYDLRRTTNIREVLPEAAMEHPSLFNWTFLSTLNAGKWFLQSGRKPFYNMKPLSEADKKRARNQSIPKLDDLLELAKKANVFLIFDLYGPSATHSLRTSFVKHVTDLILDSNIEPHLIYWLSTHDRQYVRKKAPGFQMVGRLYTTKELKKENISTINVDYKNLFYRGFRDYKAANININLYLVNEPWLFSLAWCSRIDSVTTDNIPLLSQLDSPHFFMTPRYYIFMWFLMDIISATFIIAIFCFQWHREMKKEKLNESVSTQTDSISLSKEKSGSQEASGLSVKPPARVMESPWTLSALKPALTKDVYNHPHTLHFLLTPKKKLRPVKNTVTPLKPAEPHVKSLVPHHVSEHSQASTREATSTTVLQTTLPTLKVDEPMPPVEVPMTESFREIFTTLYSNPSNMSFTSEMLSKKN